MPNLVIGKTHEAIVPLRTASELVNNFLVLHKWATRLLLSTSTLTPATCFSTGKFVNLRDSVNEKK